MTEGIIAGISSVIVAILALIGVISSNRKSAAEMSAKLDKNLAIMDTKFEAKIDKLQTNMEQKIDDNQN